jgi:hypothetical protein
MFKKFLGVIVSVGLSIAPLHATLPGEDLGVSFEAGVEAPMAVNSGAPVKKKQKKSKDWISKGIEIAEYVEISGIVMTLDLLGTRAIKKVFSDKVDPQFKSTIGDLIDCFICKLDTKEKESVVLFFFFFIPPLATFIKTILMGSKFINEEKRKELAEEFSFKRGLYTFTATVCSLSAWGLALYNKYNKITNSPKG